MSFNGKTVLRLALLTGAGFLVNQVPLEVFPGIHFVFGSAFALLAGVLYGPLAGGVVGFVVALPTWSLWNQPLPLSAVLYGLEGAAVGHFARGGRYGVITADLGYWLLCGSWLNLALQLTVVGLPLRIAFIIQCRSILNGLLAAMAAELCFLLYGLTRRSGASPESARLRPTFHSLVTLGLTALLSLPILGITLRSARTQAEQRMADLEASAEREVEAIRGEIGALVQSYGRGVSTAAEIISEHGYQSPGFLQDLLAIVHRQYPEFAGLYVADARARTLAFEPPRNEAGDSLVGLDYSDRQYYRDLLEHRSMVYSGVYQARGGMTEPAVAIGAPILSGTDGELEAFVLGWFDIGRSFQTLVGRFEREGRTVVVADREGKVIAHSNMEVGAYTTVLDLAQDPELVLQHDDTSGSFLLSPSGGSEESPAVTFGRAEHLVAFTTEPMSGWRIWIRQSVAPIRQAMIEGATLHLLILVACLLAALLLSTALARLLAAPLERLRRSAERLAAGELSERPEEPNLATAELESLFHSFSAMARELDGAWHRQDQLLQEVIHTKRDLEATFEAMTDAVVITDPEDRILRANRAFRTMGRLDADAAIEGKLLRDVSHPDGDWQSCASCFARASGDSTIALLGPEENPTGRPIEVRVDQIRDGSGRIEGSVQVIRDLTEIRRWEAEAERAESLLRNFVEAAFDPVFVLDVEGRLQWANVRTLEVFGLGRRSVRGRSYLDLIHAHDRRAAGEVLRQATAGAASRRELRLAVPGTTRHVLLTLSPVFVMQEVISVLGIARDVTEEKLAAERVRRDDKLRALGQLAAGVAHNFNNALTAVLGYTQLARAASPEPQVHRLLETVEVAAQDAAAMVRRIQQFARAEKEDPLREADVDAIVRDALELTRSHWETDAQAAGIHYEVRTLGGVDPPAGTIACDPSALREVFVNLVINALDAMPEGGTLTLETSAGPDTVQVTVSDTGCGMTEEVRERVFDPFFTTKGPIGQGMGLAVSYGTIQRHRGQIQVASEAGRGSCITIVLPQRERKATDGGSEASAVPGGPGADRPEASILVVEDEEPIRNLLTTVLTRGRFAVTAAGDGREAMEHLASRRFDLILTDLAMPRADGIAVVREAQLRWPGTKLVIMTGYGDTRREDAGTWGQDIDVDSWLAKPFDTTKLVATLETVLRGEPAAPGGRPLPPDAPAASTG